MIVDNPANVRDNVVHDADDDNFTRMYAVDNARDGADNGATAMSPRSRIFGEEDAPSSLPSNGQTGSTMSSDHADGLMTDDQQPPFDVLPHNRHGDANANADETIDARELIRPAEASRQTGYDESTLRSKADAGKLTVITIPVNGKPKKHYVLNEVMALPKRTERVRPPARGRAMQKRAPRSTPTRAIGVDTSPPVRQVDTSPRVQQVDTSPPVQRIVQREDGGDGRENPMKTALPNDPFRTEADTAREWYRENSPRASQPEPVTKLEMAIRLTNATFANFDHESQENFVAYFEILESFGRGMTTARKAGMSRDACYAMFTTLWHMWE